MKKIIILSAVLAAGLSSAALADGIVTGAVGGAATGAVVGGPVGAAVGVVAGAITGAVLDPPPREVVHYVRSQPAPVATAIVQDPVVVGEPLSSDVVITTVPENPRYGYVVVNQQRVIVDPQTRKVVQVVE